jgi:hypothetical protein
VYSQGGTAGSCGKEHSDSDLIAALSTSWMSGDSAKYCGRKITITNIGSNDNVGGKGDSVTVTVADSMCFSSLCSRFQLEMDRLTWSL